MQQRIDWSGMGIFILRLIVGIVFVAHGAQKLMGGMENVAGFLGTLGIPLAGLFAWILTLSELLCGLALIVGIVTRLANIPLIIAMLVAIFAVHLPHGFFAADRGIEYPLTLLAGCVAIALVGPGVYSLDHLFGLRYEQFLPRRQSTVTT